jgi:hypothetical protein
VGLAEYRNSNPAGTWRQVRTKTWILRKEFIFAESLAYAYLMSPISLNILRRRTIRVSLHSVCKNHPCQPDGSTNPPRDWLSPGLSREGVSWPRKSVSLKVKIRGTEFSVLIGNQIPLSPVWKLVSETRADLSITYLGPGKSNSVLEKVIPRKLVSLKLKIPETDISVTMGYQIPYNWGNRFPFNLRSLSH